MIDTLRISILGCGSSPGTPRINSDWGACDPANPKNRRMRASILVERVSNGGKTVVVVDTGPDFRAQMLMVGATALDAVVYTHGHADHVHGIDDLRSFVLSGGRRMPVYADDATFKRLREGFSYCFETPVGSEYPPILQPKLIDHRRSFEINGQGGSLAFEPLYQVHGSIHSLGFRIGNFAYCSDVSAFPDTTLTQMLNLDVLVIDALQYRPHPSHFSLEQALAVIEIVKPKRAYLTHMHVPLDYETVLRETPDHVEPSFDGQIIELAA